MNLSVSNIVRFRDRFERAVDVLVAMFGRDAALAALHASRTLAMQQIAKGDLTREDGGSIASHAVLCAREIARLTP